MNKAGHGGPYPVSLSLETERFADSLILPSAVSVLFGLNGAGKSRLLQSIAEQQENAHFCAVYDLVLYLKNEFGRRDDVDRFKEEVDPTLLRPEVDMAVKSLVRRQYTEIRWYMVEIDDSPFTDLVSESVVPFFEVDYAGVTYDFRTMGMGELTAHLLAWLFDYGAELKDRLVLLDEPESFLPAPLKLDLLEYMLRNALRNRWRLVVATHSLEMIEPALATGSAVFLNEAGNISKLMPSSSELLDTVRGIYGSTPSDRTLVLVEDEAALVLAREIFEAGFPMRRGGFAFLWCEGFGNLRAVWEHLPRPRTLTPDVKGLLFLADGDMGQEVEAAKNKHSSSSRWLFALLPGDPDVMFESAVVADVSKVADELGLTESYLSGLLARLRGQEHHRWTEAVVEAAQVPRQAALRALARAVRRKLVEERTELETFVALIESV